MQIEAVDDDETFKDVVEFIISHFFVLCLHGVIFIVRQRILCIPTRVRLSPPGNSHLLWWPEKKKTTDF